MTSVLHPTEAVTPPVGIEGWVKGLTNKSMTKEANGLKKPMTNKPMTKEVPEKKLIGTVYQCVKCGADYNAKTVWQKNCPICTAKVKSEVLKRKKKVS